MGPPKTKPVVPDEPPKLLRGKTAYDWTMRSGTYFGVSVLGLFGLTLLSVLPRALDGLDTLLSLLVLAVCLSRGMRASLVAYFATKAELQAGYTTLTVPDRPDLWLLDRKTGAVRRRPDPNRQPPRY
jgi:hypothetical protein